MGVRLKVRNRLWLVASLLVIVALLMGGCAGHPKGMKSLRWLTDEEKAKVIGIALNTPEAVEARETYGNYKTMLNWVAIEWRGNGAELWGLDYDMVDKIPDNVPESAGFYSRVEIYFGEPEQVLLRVAVNPDTGKVAHVEAHGLKILPKAP